MSLSQEALQKLYGEIQTQALKTQQELALGRSQLAAKQREKRITHLTLTEMSSLQPDTPVYEGVGKMFVAVPVTDMKTKLQSQIKQIETDTGSLEKKLHYLETTAKNSQDHLEAIFKRGNAGGS